MITTLIKAHHIIAVNRVYFSLILVRVLALLLFLLALVNIIINLTVINISIAKSIIIQLNITDCIVKPGLQNAVLIEEV